MRIGELAGTTGTTPRALRHYEQAGLISSKRAPNGYRTYDEHAAVRVRNIRYLLAAGLTLDDVRAFLPCLDGDVASAPPSGKGRQIALDRLAVLNERITAQAKIRDRLEAALNNAGTDGSAAQTVAIARPSPASPSCLCGARTRSLPDRPARRVPGAETSPPVSAPD